MSVFGPRLADVGGRLDEVVNSRELADLFVVDDEEIDALQHGRESLGLALDPEVHRVRRDQLGALDLLEHVELKLRVNVAQDDEPAVAISRGDLRREIGKDVQLGVQRGAAREIDGVAAVPAERLARGALDALRVDAADTQLGQMRVGKVRADDAHRSDAGPSEQRGCKR